MTTSNHAAMVAAVSHAIREERVAIQTFAADREIHQRRTLRTFEDREGVKFSTESLPPQNLWVAYGDGPARPVINGRVVRELDAKNQRRHAALLADRDNCVRLRKIHANRPDLLAKLADRIRHIDGLIFKGEREGRW